MLTYVDDIDEDLLVFKEHGVGLTRTTNTRDLPPRDDVEFWDVKYQAELDAGIKIGTSCPEHVRDRVIGVVNKYRDIFLLQDLADPSEDMNLSLTLGMLNQFVVGCLTMDPTSRRSSTCS
jgi:hypothetical protein